MENRCWTCRDEYLIESGINQFRCSKCNCEYYGCERCNESYDWSDNDKGIFCIECDRHFCAHCWQITGKIIDEKDEEEFDYEEGSYLCENCL